MTVYQVWIVSWACDIMCEDWGDKVFLHEKDAEAYITENAEKFLGYQEVYVRPIKVYESLLG